MKICSKNRYLRLVLPAGLALAFVAQAAAQTFTILHSFASDANGFYPSALTLSGNTLYGATAYGGRTADGRPAGMGGTVFTIKTDGTDFSIPHAILGTSGYPPPLTNFEGLIPLGLFVSGESLYGTTQLGGTSGNGTVFAVKTNGTGFTILHTFTSCLSTDSNGDFTNSDGVYPKGGLVVSGNTIFGTTSGGGSSGGGTVFAVDATGTDFIVLHAFTSCLTNGSGAYNNSDGVAPQGGLVISGNTLFGTTSGGGSSGWGTVFAVNTNGTGFKILHSFAGPTSTFGVCGIYDVWASARLTLSGDRLYGTTPFGGVSGSGTVFKLNTDGTGFQTLYDFSAGGCADAGGGVFTFTNSDGAHPVSGLILWGNTLFGTTSDGGNSGNGTVFAINIDGTGFKMLYNFSSWFTHSEFINSDGFIPNTLTFSGNTLYGTALQGGIYGGGTIFSILLLPQLTITPFGPDILLAWPTNFTGYTLQSATNLPSPAWTTNLPAPVVLNGLNTVINPVSGTQQFFRLSQ